MVRECKEILYQRFYLLENHLFISFSSSFLLCSSIVNSRLINILANSQYCFQLLKFNDPYTCAFTLKLYKTPLLPSWKQNNVSHITENTSFKFQDLFCLMLQQTFNLKSFNMLQTQMYLYIIVNDVNIFCRILAISTKCDG